MAERVGDAWENPILTQRQIHYAALDAYASLLIYEALYKIPIPGPLPSSLSTSLSVILYSDNQIIARGTIFPHHKDKQYDNINITPTRTVVDVQEVVVPGAIIATHAKKSLSDFGNAPFTLVCLRSHLRTDPLFKTQNVPPIQSQNIPSTKSDTDSHQRQIVCPQSRRDLREAEWDTLEPEYDSEFNALLLDMDAPLPDITQSHYPDPASQEEGQRILQSNTTVAPSEPIRSRVLKDPYHVFSMPYISRVHGARVEYCHRFRDAVFIPYGADMNSLIAWGKMQDPPLSWEKMIQQMPSWLWQRCRRFIPPAEELYGRVKKVFETYGPLKDAKTNQPLFNAAAWHDAKNILALIQSGYLSDPPGIALYIQMRIDSHGLPIYHCLRGSNMTEGGVHTHLRSHLPTSGVSIQHLLACLMDFVVHHNLLVCTCFMSLIVMLSFDVDLQVGTFNTTGVKYKSHYSPWLTNQIHEHLAFLEDVLEKPPRLPVGWVNGNLYTPTKEVLGVLPIPDDVRLSAGMNEYIPSLDAQRSHRFLAHLQGTSKPVLPVHTRAERKMFSELMRTHEDFKALGGSPNWKKAVKVWNRLAEDNPNLSYKVVVNCFVHSDYSDHIYYKAA